MNDALAVPASARASALPRARLLAHRFRPHQQRGGRRRGWLLSHASTARCACRSPQNWAACKHIGGSRNRGKAGPLVVRAGASDSRRSHSARDWRGAGLSCPPERALPSCSCGYYGAARRLSDPAGRASLRAAVGVVQLGLISSGAGADAGGRPATRERKSEAVTRRASGCEEAHRPPTAALKRAPPGRCINAS